MTPTWQSDDVPTLNPISASGWLRAVLRGVPLVALIFGGLVVLLLLRLIERPVFKEQRPWTPFITQTVCRGALRILGLKRKVIGTPLSGAGAIVANHSSWLDIFVLNATKRIYFVSKAEVANWPGIGWLARATGTVFIKRNRQEAASQVEVFRQRLAARVVGRYGPCAALAATFVLTSERACHTRIPPTDQHSGCSEP